MKIKNLSSKILAGCMGIPALLMLVLDVYTIITSHINYQDILVLVTFSCMGITIISIISFLATGAIGFKKAKRRLEDKWEQEGLMANYTFDSITNYLKFDYEKRMIGVVFKYNPKEPYIFSMDEVTKAYVDKGVVILNGTKSIRAVFRVQKVQINVFTFTSDQA